MSKRVTILAGHYGSGKTNIAVNMAINEAAAGKETVVADLDIVNPYFRTLDSKEDFDRAGIRLICSRFANSNVDLPAMPDDLYVITEDRNLRVIVDLGGDERGALAMGRLSGALKEEDDYEMLMVINSCRPLTMNASDTMEVFNEIEAAARLKFTGIINNTNLGRDTDAQLILSSLEYAEEVSKASGLPVVCTTVSEELYSKLEGKVPNLFPLKLQKRPV